MEIMELVDNKPQSHRFNCDWKTCNKVASYLTAWISNTHVPPFPFADDILLSGIQAQVRLATTLPNSHKRPAVPVPSARLRVKLHPEKCSDGSLTNSHWRKAL
ncbi:zinc finger protein 32 [Colletotrichum chrysophilum]|uniref:Zinc finger protein 32 n=1 Tax=Colletotrichum chrysophilum TaxID=1836956 RepID=A0AAD9AHL2_9PEZI|nr:zinc finger protein 32 [Colletotrichum chrysophilum]